MTRRLILTHVFVKARATPPAELISRLLAKSNDEEKAKFVSRFQTTFAAQQENIRTQGLWELACDDERLFFQTGVLETTMRQRIDASWLVESIVCLDWALGRIEQIPSYDQEAVPESIKFQHGERARDLIEQASLRPAAEIDAQRDLSELWHWRCRTRMLLETKRIPAALPNGTPMAELIRMIAVKVSEDGLFDSPIGNDFPTFGKPFREATEEEFISLTSISQERHKAFNWLCGYAPGNRWNETPTDT